MNFGEILDMVCKDGIAPTYRLDAKTWVRNRHAWMWAKADWTFKRTTGTVTFTANQQVAEAPTDLQAVFAIYDAQGSRLTGMRTAEFFDFYNTNAYTGVGAPEAYTVWGDSLLVGPKGDGSSGIIVYEKKLPTLTEDDDSTGLPEPFDLALVFGAKAAGYRATNNPIASSLDAEFQASVQMMESAWVEQVLEAGGQLAAYRPG